MACFFSCGQTESSGQNKDKIPEEEKNTDVEIGVVEDLNNTLFEAYWHEKGGWLIDVRTPEEYSDGFIDGAININFNNGDFENAIDTLDTSLAVFVYCQGGGRSGKARDMLVENGFLEVYNLKSGYSNWVE